MNIRKLAAMAAILLIPGLGLGLGPAGAQTPLPPFFDGMALLETNDCPSFTVSYYATPEITLAELADDQNEKGFGFIVVPKPGARLKQVQIASTEPNLEAVNYFITYQAPGDAPKQIAADVMDHAAPPESAMTPSPLFGEGGIFYTGSSYRDVLAHRTNGVDGHGTVVIEDSAAQIFRGSDGSSCTILTPKIRFQIR